MKEQKSLSWYQALDYQVRIEKETCEEETWYIAYCDELGRGSCYGTGETPQEALEQFLIDKNDFIRELLEEGRPVPEPRPKDESSNQYSGIFNVRTTPMLHAHLIRQAKQSGVSLNHYVTQLLAMGSIFGEIETYLNTKCNALEDKIDAHHYQMTNQMIDYQKHTVKNIRPEQTFAVEFNPGYMSKAS